MQRITEAVQKDDVNALMAMDIQSILSYHDTQQYSVLWFAALSRAPKCVHWLLNTLEMDSNERGPWNCHLLEFNSSYTMFKIIARAQKVNPLHMYKALQQSIRDQKGYRVRYLLKHGARDGERREWNSLVRTHQGELERAVKKCKRVMAAVYTLGKRGVLHKDVAAYLNKHFVWPKRMSKRWR